MPSFDPVTAVTRALDILRVINQLGRATVIDIKKEIDMARPTIVRMIETLVHEGYVVRDPDRPVYSPSGKCLLLSNGFDRELRLRQVGAPFLAEFRRKNGWPYSLAYFDATAMVEVASTREIGVVGARDRLVGRRIPLRVSSLGRAYLAFCPPEECAKILHRVSLNATQPDLEVSDEYLERELAETRRRGYSRAEPAFMRLIHDTPVEAFGAPIFVSGKVAATVNVSYLTTALSVEEAERVLVPELLNVAAAIGRAIEEDLGLATEARADAAGVEDRLAGHVPARSGDRPGLSGA